METSPLISPRSSASSDTAFMERRLFSDVKINDFIAGFKSTRERIIKQIDLLENLDLMVSIISYKIFECTHIFKDKISALKNERDTLLGSVENRSEMSLILNDLETKLQDLEKELDEKTNEYKQQKIDYQEESEEVLNCIEGDFKVLKELYDTMKAMTDVKQDTPYRPQTILITQQYKETFDDFKTDIEQFEALQPSGWKSHVSEQRISTTLEHAGLKFTQSGELITREGSLISFEEAQKRGFFKDIESTILTIKESLGVRQDLDDQKLIEQVTESSAVFTEPASSLASSIPNEEVKYLKTSVGKALTLALSEITAKQPKDPIHYLGHYLFKYRYNQELEIVQKAEVEALDKQRRMIAEERWHKFVEEEARNAVIDMILKAEQIALENELRRIELEQMEAEEENEYEEQLNQEALLEQEEARDKFE